ncbi:hypothetical protein [Amycolatopsis jiangsuensis]|uniref:Uncharacterized protein n=1 Tax=Amycolatopsis jiangsuensis TaxID=1181879 RepID=A0A840IWM9_9PSEU|nr:hypothetical protein [Amycolatopsis jiangsuensis]
MVQSAGAPQAQRKDEPQVRGTHRFPVDRRRAGRGVRVRLDATGRDVVERAQLRVKGEVFGDTGPFALPESGEDSAHFHTANQVEQLNPAV